VGRIDAHRRGIAKPPGPRRCRRPFQELIGVLVPQLAAGRDYVEFFLDGADGHSESCERSVLRPGDEANVLEELCGPDFF
jgi:hypothetical protein